METKTYNGWRNYETWAVALWLDNEQGSYLYWRERAQEAWDNVAPGENYSGETREDAAVAALAAGLKEEHEEAMPDLGATVWADLMGAALSEVDWREIAAHYIADVEKAEGAEA